MFAADVQGVHIIAPSLGNGARILARTARHVQAAGLRRRFQTAFAYLPPRHLLYNPPAAGQAV
ncbi:hypothetical protein [Kingella potus]|uniref:hypothetical protein n=1 Tax=Kingella potus TaxID=265175 RepID=UPI001FD2E26D|nr:hypothetical protein [Kingella potus]UOP00922.1 hypothetical protein LVJ84_00415 [Kingella potus]